MVTVLLFALWILGAVVFTAALLFDSLWEDVVGSHYRKKYGQYRGNAMHILWIIYAGPGWPLMQTFKIIWGIIKGK